MSLGSVLRGGLKTGEKGGGSKKKVRFSDEGPVNLGDTPNAAAVREHGRDGVAATDAADACPYEEKESALVEVFAKASITCDPKLHTMAGSQLGGGAEGRSCLANGESWNSSDKAFEVEVVGSNDSDGTVEEPVNCSNLSTPPSCERNGLTLWDNSKSANPAKTQVRRANRKVTFVIGAANQQTSRKCGFTSSKTQSKVQSYKVVPESEGASSTYFLPLHVDGTHTFAFPAEGACKKRCAWITQRSDAVYVAYHDDEWGVPVHEDRRLFELLVFAGAQSEIAWSSILTKREAYRDWFAQFDPAILATYDMAKTMLITSRLDIMKSEARVQSIVSNAQVVMKIVEEFGSLSDYLWGFVSYKPIKSRYKQAKSIPMRTAKSEAISKDLQKRGMRHAGPMVIYSFMQAAGLTSDHLISCFRHSSSFPSTLISPVCH